MGLLMKNKKQEEKAALLSSLLGEDGVTKLKRSGVLPKTENAFLNPQTVSWHRNRLIAKFREHGIRLDEKPNSENSEKNILEPEKGNRAIFNFRGLAPRLAKHLDPDRLADEHPAVIAMLLRSQPPQIRSQVLRELPGTQARATMRILRACQKEHIE